MDESLTNRNSVSLTDFTSRRDFSSTERENVAELRKKIMDLQAENLGLKNALPLMKNAKGEDITSQMTNLSAELSKSNQIIEDWEKRYAKQEKDFYEFQKKINEELTERENKYDRLKERAKKLEEENAQLKKKIDDDESRIFKLEQNKRYSDAEGGNESLNMLDFNHSFASDSHLRDLQDKEEENEKLKNHVAQLESTIENLRVTVEQQARALKNVIISNFDGREDSLLRFPTDNTVQYSDSDYVIAQMLGLLEELEINGRDINVLRENIVQFLREHGYNDVENKNIAELAMSFRTMFNKRRQQIRTANEELANEYRQNNTELRRHLNQLSEDSISSSLSFSINHPANESRTFDISRADILNRTADVTQNLTTVVSRMNVLRSVCNDLFSKLQGTAEFLQNLLESLDGDEEGGKELMDKIKNIHFDLNKSMGEAMMLVDEVKKAEKSISEFQNLMGQTFDQTEADESQSEEVQQSESDTVKEIRKEYDRLRGVVENNKALKKSLDQELENKKHFQEKIAYLELQLRDTNQLLEEKTRELEAKLDEHEHLETTLETLKQLLNEKNSDLEHKDQALNSVEIERRNLLKQLDDVQNTAENLRSQLNATQKKYHETVESVQGYNEEIRAKEERIVDMELKLRCLKENLEMTESSKSEKIEELERKLSTERQQIINLDKNNEILHQKCEKLESENAQLIKEIQTANAIVEEGNNIFRQRINEGYDDADASSIDGEEEGEQVADFDEFVNFLKDCEDRSNKLIQIAKKSESVSASTNITIPFIDNILNELRLLRMVLHKISKFFYANKENIGQNNKELAIRIKKELATIHATLKNAASSASQVPMTKNTAKRKE